jgi:hypothetical protein
MFAEKECKLRNPLQRSKFLFQQLGEDLGGQGHCERLRAPLAPSPKFAVQRQTGARHRHRAPRSEQTSALTSKPVA